MTWQLDTSLTLYKYQCLLSSDTSTQPHFVVSSLFSLKFEVPMPISCGIAWGVSRVCVLDVLNCLYVDQILLASYGGHIRVALYIISRLDSLDKAQDTIHPFQTPLVRGKGGNIASIIVIIGSV